MRFFDPHPGFGGCAVPLPEPVRKVASALDGQKATLKDAVAKVKAVIGKGFRLEAKKGCIMLFQGSLEETIKSGTPTHCWRVIKYRK